MLNIIPLHNLIINLRGRNTPLILYLGLKSHGTGIGKSKEMKIYIGEIKELVEKGKKIY